MKPAHENRQYQNDIEEAVVEFLLNEEGNGVVACPGGTGKSFMMAKLSKRLLVDYPGTRIIILAQDGKLLVQNSNELKRYWPEAPCGIYSAGLKQRDTDQDIIYAGIQSIAKKPEIFGERHLVIVDECDLYTPAEETRYQKFVNGLKEISPELRVIGFTATAYRLKTGCLTNLEVWDKLIVDYTKTERFNWFVDNGFLSRLVTKKPTKEVDLTGVRTVAGEYDEKQLQEVSDTDELNNAVVDECINYGSDRKHWLVFCSGVKHGYNLEKLFKSKGIPAVMLTGEDSVEFRTERENDWKAGKYRALINCGLYSRGFDFPPVDLISMVRATKSVSLWVQTCVRGTRIANGKDSCLILDHAGNIKRLGPINSPILPTPGRKKEGTGEAPIRECPECHSYVAIQAKQCPDCGFIFPPPKTITKKASTDAIMVGSEPQIEEFPVYGIRYQPKLSKAGRPYLQVRHSVGTHTYNDAVFFESDNSWLLQKSRNWWLHRKGLEPIPENANEAAERAAKELEIPTVIRVDVAKKFPEIVGCDFEESLPPYDPSKCTCSHPPHIVPCSYCESGNYEAF